MGCPYLERRDDSHERPVLPQYSRLPTTAQLQLQNVFQIGGICPLEKRQSHSFVCFWGRGASLAAVAASAMPAE
jgi:hypothetical protein